MACFEVRWIAVTFDMVLSDCSETGPNLGTLKVFPDVQLSNAYLIMRPFFRPKEQQVTEDALDVENWELGESSKDYLRECTALTVIQIRRHQNFQASSQHHRHTEVQDSSLPPIHTCNSRSR